VVDVDAQRNVTTFAAASQPGRWSSNPTATAPDAANELPVYDYPTQRRSSLVVKKNRSSPNAVQQRLQLEGGIFLIFNSFLNNILTLILQKVFANMTLLVVSARLVRLRHAVAPHAMARQAEPPWQSCLTHAGVAYREPYPVAPATQARQSCCVRRAGSTGPYKDRGPTRFPSLSSISLSTGRHRGDVMR